MPKGSKLKELWADPAWREQRIKELRENRAWIDKRAKDLGHTSLAKAIKNRRIKAKAKNYELVRHSAVLSWELAKAKRENQRMVAELQKIHINGHDRRRGSEMRAASNRGVGAPLTDEEHTLLRMACLALGMPQRQFIQEALMFYAMWAVDSSKAALVPAEAAREVVGLRSDLEADIALWRALKPPLRTAAE